MRNKFELVFLVLRATLLSLILAACSAASAPAVPSVTESDPVTESDSDSDTESKTGTAEEEYYPEINERIEALLNDGQAAGNFLDSIRNLSFSLEEKESGNPLFAAKDGVFTLFQKEGEQPQYLGFLKSGIALYGYDQDDLVQELAVPYGTSFGISEEIVFERGELHRTKDGIYHFGKDWFIRTGLLESEEREKTVAMGTIEIDEENSVPVLKMELKFGSLVETLEFKGYPEVVSSKITLIEKKYTGREWRENVLLSIDSHIDEDTGIVIYNGTMNESYSDGIGISKAQTVSVNYDFQLDPEKVELTGTAELNFAGYLFSIRCDRFTAPSFSMEEPMVQGSVSFGSQEKVQRFEITAFQTAAEGKTHSYLIHTASSDGEEPEDFLLSVPGKDETLPAGLAEKMGRAELFLSKYDERVKTTETLAQKISARYQSLFDWTPRILYSEDEDGFIYVTSIPATSSISTICFMDLTKEQEDYIRAAANHYSLEDGKCTDSPAYLAGKKLREDVDKEVERIRADGFNIDGYHYICRYLSEYDVTVGVRLYDRRPDFFTGRPDQINLSETNRVNCFYLSEEAPDLYGLFDRVEYSNDCVMSYVSDKPGFTLRSTSRRHHYDQTQILNPPDSTRLGVTFRHCDRCGRIQLVFESEDEKIQCVMDLMQIGNLKAQKKFSSPENGATFDNSDWLIIDVDWLAVRTMVTVPFVIPQLPDSVEGNLIGWQQRGNPRIAWYDGPVVFPEGFRYLSSNSLCNAIRTPKIVFPDSMEYVAWGAVNFPCLKEVEMPDTIDWAEYKEKK